MILARLSRAIRQQNWFAVLLEFVIVVAGVMLAFQITAWNAQRAEHVAEVEYLERLAIDLEDAAVDIGEQIAVESQAVRLVSLSLDFMDEIRSGERQSDIVEDELAAALSMLSIRRTLVINSPTYFELQSAGRLSLIRDRELRETIINFFGIADRMESVFLQNNEHFVDLGFKQFLRGEGVALRLRPEGMGRVPPTAYNWIMLGQQLDENLHPAITGSNPEIFDRPADDPFWQALRVNLAWRANIAVVNQSSAARMNDARSETLAAIEAYLEANE